MAARVFFSYSHKDEALRDELEVQLSMLKRQGLIETWHDRRLIAGEPLDSSIQSEIEEADIVLLLISPDFLSSDYCYEIEKSLALSKQKSGQGRAISVILRPCDWKHTDLSNYLVTPKDGQPITKWPDRDEAFLNVAKSIRSAIEEIGKADQPRRTQVFATATPVEPSLPRSSNLRLRKEFTQADKDDFLIESFDFMKLFFQGSLDELEKRNDGFQTRFREIDGNHFTATVYKNGAKVSACSIRLGGMHSNGISYSVGDDARMNSYNDGMSVESDDQKLFLRPMGMSSMFAGNLPKKATLSDEGAAEYFWESLIAPLQGH